MPRLLVQSSEVKFSAMFLLAIREAKMYLVRKPNTEEPEIIKLKCFTKVNNPSSFQQPEKMDEYEKAGLDYPNMGELGATH